MKYEKYKRECYYPLYGSNKDKVKGLIPLGRMALTGDRRLKKCLKPGLDKITGEPICIPRPEKLKEFGEEWNHRINQSGTIIIKGGLTEYAIQDQTVQLNRWINLYCSDEIEPFSPGGASHVDFIIVEVPDPDKPGKMIKRLGLDVQVSRKE